MSRHLFAVLLTASLVAIARGAEAPAGARPRIGLVLGGGGALGMSHVGVLRVLEEQRIPIDCIAGTSMGSIIAGLYASGLSPDEIEAFLKGLDWREVMSDETPRRELFFRRKREDQRYLFEMGMTRGRPSMGTGMAAGQKLNNLLEFITLRSASITNFDALPIPYRAVATDLQSGEPLVLSRGNLATAMRASMAVPGVFTAVDWEGRLVVDGGVVNNLPVDVAKAMGADVVIAVDVGAAGDRVDPESLKTLGGVLGRTYAIAQRPGQIEMFKRADIGIQPELAGLTASQFERVAEFIPLGEAAARAQTSALARLSVDADQYARYLARQRLAPQTAPMVSTVRIEGEQRVDEAVIRGRIRSQPGAPFDIETVRRDLMRVYGVGEFQQVLFRLAPDEVGEPALTYRVTEKPWGPTYLKYGLQLRSDFEQDADWRMLINLTRMSLNRLGAEWRNEVQLGSTQMLESEFYQPLDHRGFLFLAPRVELRDATEDVYDGHDRIAEYDVQSRLYRFDLGVQLRQYAELRLGPYAGHGRARAETGAAGLPELDEDLAGWMATLTVDRQDRSLFAREGYYVQLEGQFARDILGGERDYDRLSAVARQHISWGDHTLTFGVQGGSGGGDELPSYAQFKLGGPFVFAGLAEEQFRGDELAVGSLGYRYRLQALPSPLGRALYALTRLDVGNVWADGEDHDDLRTGVAAGLGADTVLGPLYLAYGIADGGYHRIYFSLGTAF